jgi:Asp-tRNA(Asn)/Glu-tRNA(Gln) amidotransferase A subunit family amidase
VRDSAAVLDAVCGSSFGDPYTTPLTASLAAALDGALPRLRVGVRLRGANEGIDAHPEVARSIREIADLLAAHGHDVVDAAPVALDEIEAVAQQGTVVAACIAAELDAWSARLGREITLTLGWGAVSRIDLLPATCSDPSCDAEHGFEGTVSSDDISLRVSADAEGEAALRQALSFAQELSASIGR